MRKTEAKYFTKKESFKDSNSDSSKGLDSSDDIVYVKKRKRKSNKIRFEDCNQELNQKNYARQIQSLKHKRSERVHKRNKIVESANETGVNVTNEDTEQKIDKQYPELEGKVL